MKIIDNMPIVIIVAALFTNIALGVSRSISFSALMIRCIVVTILFGVFGYMLTETIKNTIECSRINRYARDKNNAEAELEENLEENEDKPILDIKVPPLDEKELMSMNNDSNDGFVEVNPVYMSKYKQSKQD